MLLSKLNVDPPFFVAVDDDFFLNCSGKERETPSFLDAKIFVLRSFYVVKSSVKIGVLQVHKEIQDLKKRVSVLRQLGEDWRKNVSIINKATNKDARAMQNAINRLHKKGNEGNLVKTGLTLIAFPLPIVIDDVLGWSFLAAGLVQRRIKNSGLYLDDINKTFHRLKKELHETRHELVHQTS